MEYDVSTDLEGLAKQIKMQKQQQRLSRLSPFWAKRQALKNEEEGGNGERPASIKQKPLRRTDQVDMSGLKNLKQLTKKIPLMERARTAHRYMPTFSFRSKPRWDERKKRSLDGRFQIMDYWNTKELSLGTTKRELKFPLQGQGANTYYEGCSTHTKWVDDSKAATVLRELWNVPFGSRKDRKMPFDVSKTPLSHDLNAGGIMQYGLTQEEVDESKKIYKLSRRQQNQIKRERLAEIRNKYRQAELDKVKGSSAFKDKVKREPTYGLVPFGNGLSEFRQPGPGPATDSASADRLSLHKKVLNQAGGKFKGGNRATMPIIGQDAPPIWTEPNTLDCVPLEAVTKAVETIPKIAPINKTLKAHNYPECIMKESQGGENLSNVHMPWVKPSKDTNEKKGAQLHYAFGSYSARFNFDMGQREDKLLTSEMTSPLPTSFEIKDPKRTSMVFRCTEQRHLFGKHKTKNSTLVLEKHNLLDSWNTY